jgi:secreted trypsin-like serine protease
MDGIELLRRFITFLIVSASFSCGLAGTRDPNTPDEKYVEFGKSFPAVVRIRALIVNKDPAQIETLSLAPKPDSTTPPDVEFQVGSAVVIKPHWMLTAAHVVRGATVVIAEAEDKTKHTVDKIIVHHLFEDEKFGFHDIALCYSATPFDMPFYVPLHTELNEPGQAVTIAGYGRHGTFHTGHTSDDNKKRAGHNRIDSSERTILICTPSVKHDKFPLEFMIAPGDSGGGMFIGNKLAGINSFLMAADKKPDGTYGDESAFTRVSVYVDWIHEQIDQHERFILGRTTLAPAVAEK